MLVSVLCAPGGALLADVGTERANRLGLSAAARHMAHGGLAKIRAIEIQANAAGKLCRAWLAKTRDGAVQACDPTSVDTVLIGLMRHFCSPGGVGVPARHAVRGARRTPCGKDAVLGRSQSPAPVRFVIGAPCGSHVRQTSASTPLCQPGHFGGMRQANGEARAPIDTRHSNGAAMCHNDRLGNGQPKACAF